MLRREERANSQSFYLILLGLAEVFGIIAVFLIGFTFGKSVFPSGYDWDKGPFPYHPLLMTIGLLFCYGNAILFYRTFRDTQKLIVKILHAVFLLTSLILAIVGLTAIIRSKNLGKRPHFMSYHSWLGLATLVLFASQWLAGFLCYLFPKATLNIRQFYMPTHRFWGKMIFTSAVIAILTGLSEHGVPNPFFTENDAQRKRRLIMNFFAVFTSFFYLVVIYLLTNPNYQRPPEEVVPKSSDDTF